MKRKNKNIKIGYHVVAFMDVMGQQEKLRSFDKFSDLTNEDVIFKLKETYGVITGLRKFFNSYFESFKSHQRTELPVPDNKKGLLKHLKSNPIRMHQFSDFVIAFFSLRENGDAKLPVSGIHAIFGAAAAASITCLAKGNPLRGGIDIGWGVEMKHDEIYGGGLAKAYALESKTANFPRIVIGSSLLEYLQNETQRPQVDEVSLISSSIAKNCLELVIKGEDGVCFIDYLGEHFREIDDTELHETVLKAYDFVKCESERHKANMNEKLALKYSHLKSYMKSREEVWGLHT